MYRIIFYESASGEREVEDYILDLKKKADKGNKDARIRFNKIAAYIDVLEEIGTWMGEPFTKHLSEDIWELRPLNDRILYSFFDGDSFILLSSFKKTTRKTPTREIDKAKRRLKEYKERKGENNDEDMG